MKRLLVIAISSILLFSSLIGMSSKHDEETQMTKDKLNKDKVIERISNLTNKQTVDNSEVQKIREWLSLHKNDHDYITGKIKNELLTHLEQAKKPSSKTFAVSLILNDLNVKGSNTKEKIFIKRAEIFERKGWKEGNFTEKQNKLLYQIEKHEKSKRGYIEIHSIISKLQKEDELLMADRILNTNKQFAKQYALKRLSEIDPQLAIDLSMFFLQEKTNEANASLHYVAINNLYDLGKKTEAIRKMKEGMIEGYNVSIQPRKYLPNSNENFYEIQITSDLADAYEKILLESKNTTVRIIAIRSLLNAGEVKRAKPFVLDLMKDLGYTEENMRDLNAKTHTIKNMYEQLGAGNKDSTDIVSLLKSEDVFIQSHKDIHRITKEKKYQVDSIKSLYDKGNRIQRLNAIKFLQIIKDDSNDIINTILMDALKDEFYKIRVLSAVSLEERTGEKIKFISKKDKKLNTMIDEALNNYKTIIDQQKYDMLGYSTIYERGFLVEAGDNALNKLFKNIKNKNNNTKFRTALLNFLTGEINDICQNSGFKAICRKILLDKNDELLMRKSVVGTIGGCKFKDMLGDLEKVRKEIVSNKDAGAMLIQIDLTIDKLKAEGN